MNETQSEAVSWDFVPRWLFLAVPLAAAIAHVPFTAFFYTFGLPAMGHLDVAIIAVYLVAFALTLKGRPYVGFWITLGAAVPHLVVISIAVGPGAGIIFFQVGFLILPFLFFRGHPRQMVSGVALIVLGAATTVVAGRILPPWLKLDQSVLDTLFVANLSAVILIMITLSFLGAYLARRQVLRLQREVAEARLLGQYTLGEQLGEGGMGQVFRATHALLRRPAAIKLIREDKVSDVLMRRFENEVQLTSKLSHPNTIAIYDYGHTPDGVFYYVMEYLEGIDLKALVERYGRQPPARVVRILRQAVAALEEAHRNGLVHRDIKPANIVLCCRGDVPDMVKVLDFGLVKDLEGPEETGDVIVGTPAYLSPEMISTPEEIGPATDLYALGAVGYFLLTGLQLFDKQTLVSLCAAHLNERPVPPSQRIDAPVPAPLEELIMACLEKSIADRPKSAYALRRELERLEKDYQWDEEEARAWWTEHEQSWPQTPEPDPSAQNRAAAASKGGFAGTALSIDVRGRGADLAKANDE
jgi:tRNA A-37 threonylcarbamoyl transferase component Bud32